MRRNVQHQSLSPHQTHSDDASSKQQPVRKLSWKVFFYVGYALLWAALSVPDLVSSSTTNRVWPIIAFACGALAAVLLLPHFQKSRPQPHQKMGPQSATSETARSRSILYQMRSPTALMVLTLAFVYALTTPSNVVREVVMSFTAGGGVTGGFYFANRERRGLFPSNPYRDRMGNYD
jgi:hypothetical protein